MKLHVAPPSPRAFKVLAVARYLGLDFELVPVELLNGANQRPEFIALNPNKKMPVLEDDGFVLWESNAITQYLATKTPEVGLLPSDPRRRADVSRWQFWENAHWDPACSTLLFEHFVKTLFGQGDPDPAQITKGEEKVRRFGGVLNGWLAGRRYLRGDHLTLADFSVGAWLNYAPDPRVSRAQPLVRRIDGATGVARIDRRSANLNPEGPECVFGTWSAGGEEIPRHHTPGTRRAVRA